MSTLPDVRLPHYQMLINALVLLLRVVVVYSFIEAIDGKLHQLTQILKMKNGGKCLYRSILQTRPVSYSDYSRRLLRVIKPLEMKFLSSLLGSIKLWTLGHKEYSLV